MRKTIVSLFLLAVVAALAAGGYAAYRYQEFLTEPVAVPAEGYLFTVPAGASLRVVAQQLARDGVIDDPYMLRIMGRLDGTAARIKAGEYRVPASATPRQLVQMLVDGAVVQHSLTIVEGWTFQQMMDVVRGHPALEQTLDGKTGEEIMSMLGEPDTHPEGMFYPDTYHFPRGTADIDFLRRAHRIMQQRLEEVWAKRSADLPLKNPYEALVLASLIERETAVSNERTRIAGVFVRRLRKGMRLQTDPTVIYGMGDAYDGNIRRRDLLTDTPYNTYTRRGLPPTPIAMPSGDSLAAAVNPAAGNELYFVARGDGSHHFSATLEEHNEAVRRFLLRGR